MRWKETSIIEAEVCPDHIHMLIEIPSKFSISSVMGYLKGKSSLAIYERWKMQNSGIETENFDVKDII